MSQGVSSWRMPDASEPQRQCLAFVLRSRNKKQLAIFFYIYILSLKQINLHYNTR